MAELEYPDGLRYPEEDGDYSARVIFTIKKDEPTGTNDGIRESRRTITQDNLKDIRKQQEELVNERRQENITSSQFTEKNKLLNDEIDALKNQIQTFNAANNPSEVDARIGIFGTSVELYLPLGIQYRDNVTYENFDIGSVGAAMEGGLGFAESMMKGVGSFVTNITGGGGNDLARLAAIQLSGKAKGAAAELQAVQKLSGGITLNPNSRVLFKQPNIREFAFAFKFVARSENEAKIIDQIIRFFRTELYPDEITANVGNTSVSLGYRFPNKFNIAFEYNGEEIRSLAKIKDCYLRDVSTTFNPTTMAMHKGGYFTEIDMNLSFQETRALVRKDVSRSREDKGGY